MTSVHPCYSSSESEASIPWESPSSKNTPKCRHRACQYRDTHNKKPSETINRAPTTKYDRVCKTKSTGHICNDIGSLKRLGRMHNDVHEGEIQQNPSFPPCHTNSGVVCLRKMHHTTRNIYEVRCRAKMRAAGASVGGHSAARSSKTTSNSAQGRT